MNNLKKQLQNLLEHNQLETLKEKLNQILEQNKNNPEILKICREFFEKTGDISGAIKSLNLLIKLDTTNVELISDLANYFQLTGNFKMFEKNILKCIRLKPTNIEYYIQLEDYYKSFDNREKLITLYSEAFKNTKNKIFEIKLKNLINKTSATSVNLASPELLSDIHLIEFLSLFEGLKNIYARQWVREDGKSGYLPVREPFTMQVLKRHLSGAITAGIYPINQEGKVKFIAFDLDVEKFARKLFDNNEEYRQKVFDKMKAVVKQIQFLLKEYSISSYVEFSGYKGYHIWVFFSEWISAVAAKQFGKKILDYISVANEPFHIEFFPKQTKASVKNPGNLIKLPLGIHLKTKVRSYFVDNNFSKIDADTFISKVIPVSKDAFYNALKSLPYSPEIDKVPIPIDNDKKNTENKAEKEDEFIFENDLKFKWIYNKCYAIRTIVDKINSTYELTNNEIIVLKYTLGYFDNGPDIVNALLKKCVNVKPEQFMKSKFKGNPTSCVKIRQRLGTLLDSSKCNCEFPNLINFYPNPLAHLDEMPFAEDENKLQKLKIRIMIENYLRLKKELAILNDKLRKTENDIVAFLQDVEISKIETTMGTAEIKVLNGKLDISIKV